MREPTDKIVPELIFTAQIIVFLTAGALGAFGAAAHYLFLVVKQDAKFELGRLVMFSLMGTFVGLVVHFMMLDLFGRSQLGVVLVSGFLFLQILDFINIKGLDVLLNKANLRKRD